MGLDERHLDERPAGHEGEAILAELAETVEIQAEALASLHEQIDRLEAERQQLQDELQIAHAWVRELAAELELVVARAAEPFPLSARIRARSAPLPTA
jgi:predicted RNase H-like nuclease (RuvC/YqgF family)